MLLTGDQILDGSEVPNSAMSYNTVYYSKYYNIVYYSKYYNTVYYSKFTVLQYSTLLYRKGLYIILSIIYTAVHYSTVKYC